MMPESNVKSRVIWLKHLVVLFTTVGVELLRKAQGFSMKATCMLQAIFVGQVRVGIDYGKAKF